MKSQMAKAILNGWCIVLLCGATGSSQAGKSASETPASRPADSGKPATSPGPAGELDTVQAIMKSGPDKRLVVHGLVPSEKEGTTRFVLGGPPPGTWIVEIREQEGGEYAWNSNVQLLSIDVASLGLKGKAPDFSDFSDGVVLRFFGKVAIGPCVFEGAPLSFVWVGKHGLVYLSGEGQVKLADGTIVRLPAAQPTPKPVTSPARDRRQQKPRERE